MADEGSVFVVVVEGVAAQGKGMVDGITEVGDRVQERTVQIENDGFVAGLQFHQGKDTDFLR